MEKRNNNWMSVVVFVLLCILIISVIVGIFCDTLKINDENVIIGFIGTLAAFVVINNFTQVADIRNNTENELNRMREKMMEIKNETKEDVERSQKELDVMSQKINALTKGYGIEEIAIKELFNYKEVNIHVFERMVSSTYYCVRSEAEEKTFLVKVSGAKENKTAEKCSPKDYLDSYKEEKIRNDRMQTLIENGIPKSEFE